MTFRSRFLTFVSALAVTLSLGGAAHAHPHVWVTTQSEVLYDDAGHVAGIRHVWVFDEFYSTFASQGLDANGDGKFDRAELQALAKENVESLSEFDYFTFVKANGQDAAIGTPRDYWLEHRNGVLVLRFTLPLANPVDARKLETGISIYDPTYYVAFAFAKTDPIKLAATAPAGCRAELVGQQKPQAASASLGESFFQSLDANSDFGAQYAQGAAIRCDAR